MGTTQRVFEAIKDVKPEKLYLASDGPRNEVDGEAKTVEGIRSFLLENINWKCEVQTKFSDHNLGCKHAVSNAIEWFFESEESGVILEDDCLPNVSFFRFCDELLDRYKDDKRVWHIAGNNFQNGWKRNPNESYYFSYYGSIWGWATWKDRWEQYDVEMKFYNEEEVKRRLGDLFVNKKETAFRLDSFNAVKRGLDTWDYQWVYTRLVNSGLSIVPGENLVKNIGFGVNATHTIVEDDERADMKVSELEFPLKDPKYFIRDKVSDDRFFSKLAPTKYKKIKRRLKKIIKRWR